MIECVLENLSGAMAADPGLEFLEMVGGLAFPQVRRDGDKDKTLPVSRDFRAEMQPPEPGCEAPEKPRGFFLPKKSTVGLCFWELENPPRVRNGGRFRMDMSADVRLVLWWNSERLEPEDDCNADRAVLSALRRATMPPNSGISGFRLNFRGEHPRDPREAFGRYTIGEAEFQLCAHPYRVNVLHFQILYSVACFEPVTVRPKAC